MHDSTTEGKLSYVLTVKLVCQEFLRTTLHYSMSKRKKTRASRGQRKKHGTKNACHGGRRGLGEHDFVEVAFFSSFFFRVFFFDVLCTITNSDSLPFGACVLLCTFQPLRPAPWAASPPRFSSIWHLVPARSCSWCRVQSPFCCS